MITRVPRFPSCFLAIDRLYKFADLGNLLFYVVGEPGGEYEKEHENNTIVYLYNTVYGACTSL